MTLNDTSLIAILVIIGVWLLVTNVLLFQMLRRYRRLTQGIKKKELRELQKTTKQLKKWLKDLEKEEENHVQKVGFIRFNPFSDTGGNQSFCLAVLDGHDDGVVISSLHSREHTRLYAKAIFKGKTEDQELSKEEKEALKRAKNEK